MRQEQVASMQTLFIADKSLPELESLFGCDIAGDDDFYDVVAFNIVQTDPGYFCGRLDSYNIARLRAAIFGLGWSTRRDQEQLDVLSSMLKHSDPSVVAEAIDALLHSEHVSLWPEVKSHTAHKSPYVRGAVARFARASLPLHEAIVMLEQLLADDDPIVKQSVIDELGELGEVRATQAIRPYLEDEDENVRLAAATAINTLSNR